MIADICIIAAILLTWSVIALGAAILFLRGAGFKTWHHSIRLAARGR